MGKSPKKALRLALTASTEIWTAKIDGRAEAMFGLVVTNALCGVGTPWLLGTDVLYRHPRTMIRAGDSFVRRWFDSTGQLSNYVSKDNTRALRLLRRWGFSIGSEVIMFSGVEFLLFEMSR